MNLKYKSGYKYQLQEDFVIKIFIIGYSVKTDFITLDKKGLLTIKKGYCWDGATAIPDFKCVMKAALVHDALYQLIRQKYLPMYDRVLADQEFYKISVENGTWRIFAKIIVNFLMVFCEFAAAQEKKVFVIK